MTKRDRWVMQPAATLLNAGGGGGVDPPIERRARFWRLLAVSPFAAAAVAGAALPAMPNPRSSTAPLYIRRGRYPVRALVNGESVVIAGPDWHECPGEFRLELLGNDQSDAAITSLLTSTLGATTGGLNPASPGLAYQYVVEYDDAPPDTLHQPYLGLGAQAQATKEKLCTAAGWTLLDYTLPRCFDRNVVTIQNKGANGLLLATLGEFDLMNAAGLAPAPSDYSILDASPSPGAAAGGSLSLSVGWGVSFWGKALTANQTAGQGTVVTEA